MIFCKPAGEARAKRIAALVGAVTLTVSGFVSAQDDTAVSISPDVFNMYLESRIQKPADQATAEETALVREELTDIYLLSDEPRAQALKESPRLKAQIELQTRAMLAQAVATDFITRNSATAEEMRALYDEQITLAPPTEYKARHILVETQSAATDLIAQLEGGADFAELATTNSTGPSGPSGGDLGWFSPDRMVPEFSTAVQALANGEFTKAPVQTQYGWHVILREDSRESPPPPFESVTDALKQQVENEKLRDYILGLRQPAAE
ncbi:MAG: peptidylprolyl isomerase [Gammaproteobacteria bacterium]|nr:peptidylprolyl isomerase [Gammaproteobacteria bacterium]